MWDRGVISWERSEPMFQIALLSNCVSSKIKNSRKFFPPPPRFTSPYEVCLVQSSVKQDPDLPSPVLSRGSRATVRLKATGPMRLAESVASSGGFVGRHLSLPTHLHCSLSFSCSQDWKRMQEMEQEGKCASVPHAPLPHISFPLHSISSLPFESREQEEAAGPLLGKEGEAFDGLS